MLIMFVVHSRWTVWRTWGSADQPDSASLKLTLSQGFAMGILTGTILYPSISETKTHRYTIWAARVVALALMILAFVLTIKNFCESKSMAPNWPLLIALLDTDDPNAACEWCRFLSCIPTSANDRCSGTGLTTVANTAPNRRWGDL